MLIKTLFFFILLNVISNLLNLSFDTKCINYNKSNDTIIKCYYNEDTIYTGRGMPIMFDSILSHPNTAYIELLSSIPISYQSLQEKIKIISNLKKIKCIYFGNIIRDSLPREILLLENLEQISFEGPSEMYLEQAFTVLSDLTKLKTVVLRRHHDVPTSICQIKSLEVLDLAYSKLDSLPSCIGELPNLKTVSLACGYINNLDAVIEPLMQSKTLENLGLSSLHIKKIPPNVAQIKNLKILDLWRNSIDTLPCSLANRGIEIDLGSNLDTVIPDCFKQK